MELIKQPSFEQLYNESAFTIEGAGGDLNDWMEGINKELEEREIGHVDTFYTYTGEDMNNYFDLTGSNAYSSDFTFLSFPLDNLDVGKLAIFKMQFGARWFDDIVANNVEREGRGYHYHDGQEPWMDNNETHEETYEDLFGEEE